VAREPGKSRVFHETMSARQAHSNIRTASASRPCHQEDVGLEELLGVRAGKERAGFERADERELAGRAPRAPE
jgi:hypothetical protein